jgi:hypothetical protein
LFDIGGGMDDIVVDGNGREGGRDVAGTCIGGRGCVDASADPRCGMLLLLLLLLLLISMQI